MRRGLAHLRLRGARALMLVSVLVLGACSATQIAYDHADALVRWQVGRYVELDTSQRQQWKAAFANVWHWHRTTQLPAYAAALRDLSLEVGRGALDPGRVNVYAKRVEAFTDTLYRQAFAPASALLASLSDAQVASMVAKMHKDIAREAAEHADDNDEAARRSRAAKATARGLRGWVGRLSDEQQAMIEDWSRGLQLPPAGVESKSADAWVDRLGDVLARRGETDFALRLRAFIDEPYDAGRTSEEDEQRARWFDLLSRLSATLSSDQRRRFGDRLEGFARDFEELSRERPEG